MSYSLWSVALCLPCAALAWGASSPNRTVVFMFYSSEPGQDVFLRGGLDASTHEGCTDDVATDACAIPIRTHLLGTIEHYDKYNSWRVGDTHFDWHGVEPGQGTYAGEEAFGTPMAWTTNNVLSPGFQELNKFGDHFWMVDMEMDCSYTDQQEGWFDFKAYLSNYAAGWEPDVAQAPCTGTLGGYPSYSSVNHIARCGAINVFSFGLSDCTVDAFEE